MLNQSFDEKTLLKLTTKKEIINFKLGRNTNEYVESLKSIAKKINNDSFSFSTINSFQYNGKIIYKINSPEECYTIKKISDNIKRLYKIKFSSKEDIVNQVINILSDTSSYRVFRLDVKEFFESIDFKSVLDKLSADNILSNSSLSKLHNLRQQLPSYFRGLPRGLAISSVLAELYMEEIDNIIRSEIGIYFYARYVDDIIIVLHDENIDMTYFEKIFSNKKLLLNNKSTKLNIPSVNYSDNTYNFNFLGYTYLIHNITDDDGFRKITVDISTKKQKKIKTRIIQSILAYSRDHNDELLIKRIKFLSGNYSVNLNNDFQKKYSEEDGSILKGGIYYNNKFINTDANLSTLNDFIKKLLFCKKKNSIGRAVQKIPISTRRILISHCFVSGHFNAIFHDFTSSDIKEINKCWR
ncbi:antiviral reverse transcriptase Drt3a [Citrobacter freundii]|uniref:antiviral reverse transcriptase Drt3a n=3 Tax=Citrobacter freundii TaxID=546 RepID=UPI001A2AD2A9|nr:antiviral reverse transcriptase Drt3a [Citrobacter freundii]MCX2440210.1 RNA-directed DNA polymerase [Citrobacter freundii]MCX2469102.1 RNA-directed DNA polymerase [Citrobacter freundii]MDX7503092.1 antiviral reverse transcriptase Drt3a [Citrobacter freundii]UZQ89995.1 RNA-directed DNA polymerase [Citrobacter freundii]UZQ96333.1 RNA-directed DNA polymerase [Citrobacter freundii]